MSDEQALLLGKFENWSSKFSMGLSPATPVEWEELSDLMLTAAKQTRRLSAPPEAPQQARVELAERISGWADDMEDSVPDQDDLRMIADLREAASALRNQAKALEAADELALVSGRSPIRQGRDGPIIDYRHWTSEIEAARAAYRSTRPTTEGEDA